MPKEEGYEVVLVNSNPATIMTDPGKALFMYETNRGKRNSGASKKEREMDAVIERNFGNFLWSSYN